MDEVIDAKDTSGATSPSLHRLFLVEDNQPIGQPSSRVSSDARNPTNTTFSIITFESNPGHDPYFSNTELDGDCLQSLSEIYQTEYSSPEYETYVVETSDLEIPTTTDNRPPESLIIKFFRLKHYYGFPRNIPDGFYFHLEFSKEVPGLLCTKQDFDNLDKTILQILNSTM
jgi:hypothetical protein